MEYSGNYITFQLAFWAYSEKHITHIHTLCENMQLVSGQYMFLKA
jgi:hypothetical protein